jgi:hypothetical protein
MIRVQCIPIPLVGVVSTPLTHTIPVQNPIDDELPYDDPYNYYNVLHSKPGEERP